ncbi:MAG: AmmeMemoRadiSam system protein B [Candidatus Pacebacteria bacterium]|nr:AmmeMemoRadiSam system protein B [Candidatus Paceibacterota bacterium]
MLKFASICPHPPIMIPSIGKNHLSEIKSTLKAMNELGNRIKKEEISTIAIISPHGPVQMDTMSINGSETINGNFLQFGDDTSMKIKNNLDLVGNIKKISEIKNITTEIVRDNIPLDHGVMVPLYFLKKHSPEIKIVSIAFSYLDFEKHFEFGEAIYEAIETIDENIALIASGDLSHRLIPESPSGYSPKGKEFDELLIKYLKNNEVSEIINLNSELIENAGECGLRSIIILLGALSSLKYKFQKMSYEGPFGVGYLVGEFKLLKNNK